MPTTTAELNAKSKHIRLYDNTNDIHAALDGAAGQPSLIISTDTATIKVAIADILPALLAKFRPVTFVKEVEYSAGLRTLRVKTNRRMVLCTEELDEQDEITNVFQGVESDVVIGVEWSDGLRQLRQIRRPNVVLLPDLPEPDQPEAVLTAVVTNVVTDVNYSDPNLTKTVRTDVAVLPTLPEETGPTPYATAEDCPPASPPP